MQPCNMRNGIRACAGIWIGPKKIPTNKTNIAIHTANVAWMVCITMSDSKFSATVATPKCATNTVHVDKIQRTVQTTPKLQMIATK